MTSAIPGPQQVRLNQLGQEHPGGHRVPVLADGLGPRPGCRGASPPVALRRSALHSESGGTGVHARWLAADSHRVHVVDPVPSHVEQAARVPGVSASLGDARALDAADDSVDVTLLLGPLYHLVDADDRALALREAIRVTRPGGLVAAAAITRHAALLELTGLGLLDDAAVAEVTGLLATGVNTDDPDGFTTAYFHHVGEFRSEVVRSGLTAVTVYGVEGPAAPALDNAAPADAAAVLASAARCARLVETDPALIAASPHLIAIGTVR